MGAVRLSQEEIEQQMKEQELRRFKKFHNRIPAELVDVARRLPERDYVVQRANAFRGVVPEELSPKPSRKRRASSPMSRRSNNYSCRVPSPLAARRDESA